MSERFVKIALALSVFCVIASAVFYVSTLSEGAPAAPTTAAVPEQPAGTTRQRERSFEHFAPPLAETPARSEELAEVRYDESEGEEPLLDGEGLIAGRVFLNGAEPVYALAQVFLIPVRLEPKGTFEDEASSDGEAPADGADVDEAELQAISEEVSFNGQFASPEEEEAPYVDPVDLDETGAFEEFVAPGEYRLVARAPGHKTIALEGVVVASREEVRDIKLELDEGQAIAGVVTSPDGTRHGEVEVTLEGEGYFQTRFTDGDGEFDFDSLPDGTFKLEAYDPGTGRAEAVVRSGDKSVSLQMGFQSLTGVVIDALGQPAAGVEVLGRANYRVSLAADRDPWGSVDGVTSVDDAKASQDTEAQHGLTDEQGRFAVNMASDGPVSLSVHNHDGQFAFIKDVAPASRDVQVRLTRGTELRLRVTPLPDVKDMPELRVDLEHDRSGDEEADEQVAYSAQSQATRGGELLFYVPQGMPFLLRHDAHARVELLSALPANVKMGALRKVFRGFHHPHIAIIGNLNAPFAVDF